MDIFVKNKPHELNRWWTAWGVEMEHFHRKYGNSFGATRLHLADGTPGEWILKGNEDAIRTFRDMAVQAAEKTGYRGGPHGAVQFWLDHMNGDHVMRQTQKLRKDDDRMQIVTNNDGTKEGYRGRQRIG